MLPRFGFQEVDAPAPGGSQRHRRCTVSLAPTEAQRASPATNQWTHNSTTATDVGTEEVLIAGMQLLSDAWRLSFKSHSGAKGFTEQEVLALTRVVNGQTEHARMDLVFNLIGSVTYLDVSIVAPFSCNPSLVSAASTKPGLMAKRAEKNKFDRYPDVNLVPFIPRTTGRPGPHARKYISYLMRDADQPPLAIRDTWSAIQNVLHSAISKQQPTAAMHRAPGCKYRPTGTHTVFSVSSLPQSCHVALL